MVGGVLPEVISCSLTKSNGFSDQLLSFAGVDRQVLHKTHDACLIRSRCYDISPSLQIAVNKQYMSNV